MADRKVLIKYYPPDFDPEKLAQKGRFISQHSSGKRRRVGGSKIMNVRFMFPFTMCCGMCNEFIYIGTKFNSRVEKIKGEDYLGIAIWRFYARCPHCRAEIAFKTDPKNTEYILESGGTRTYDPRKDAQLAEDTLKEQLENEITTDSIRALEHKTSNTADELQALDQLDQLRKINKRFLSREATVDKALQWLKQGGLDPTDQKALNELDFLDEIYQFSQSKQAYEAEKLLGNPSNPSDIPSRDLSSSVEDPFQSFCKPLTKTSLSRPIHHSKLKIKKKNKSPQPCSAESPSIISSTSARPLLNQLLGYSSDG